MSDVDIEEFDPINHWKNVCAIEFAIRDNNDRLNVLGTINFHDPFSNDLEQRVHVSMKMCNLNLRLFGCNMPLKTCLFQKIFRVAPVGDVVGSRKETTERKSETAGSLEMRKLLPKFIVKGKKGARKEVQKTSASFDPEYTINIDMCGDDRAPAWRISSRPKEAPLVGVLREEEFGEISVKKDQADVICEISVHPDDVQVEAIRPKGGRKRAIESVLNEEIRKWIDEYGPISSQNIKISRREMNDG